MLLRHRLRRAGAQVTALAVAAVGGMAVLGPAQAHAASTVIGATLTTSDLSQALTPQPGIALGPVSSGSVNLKVDDT
ncbi:hypothetical protein PYK79_51310, partial [Streptomyces sp. ID05-04B]